MKNTYNFNVEIETPEKTNQEQILFLKWKPILRRVAITQEVIEEYKNDLLTLKLNPMKAIATLLLFTSFCYSQTYVYSVKLSKVLTTTAASNPTLYKQNIFELKECQNNNDALAKGLKVNEFYRLPMKDNIVLIAVVVAPVPPTTGTIENQTIYLSKEK
jgi:hypothetical protein